MTSERELEAQSSAAATGVPAADPGGPAGDPGGPAGDPGVPAGDPGRPATSPIRAHADKRTAVRLRRGWFGRPSARRIVSICLFAVALAVIWEGAKWLFGDPWRLDAIGYNHTPPFPIPQLSDLQLPHLWTIFGSFSEPFQRNADYTLGNYLLDQALYTWSEAIIGFVLGAAIGVALASLFVHFGLFERAFVPYVVASQTVPIVALAPLIVVGFGHNLTSIVIIATYLTFFPVTISMIRGLRSPDPRAIELMRSFAASRWSVYWKLRLPASVPYLFTALKIAAAASIVGTIIGEGPGGVQQGLGRAILTFNQQYITGPEKLWATIMAASLLGIIFFVLVRIVEVASLARTGRRAATS